MTCVIVTDASCLIDLRKGGLLGVLGNLPYRLIVPLPIRASELLDFSDQEWRPLDAQGMITHDLTPVGHLLVVFHVGPQGHGILATGEGCLKRFPDARFTGLRRAVQHARPACAAIADDQRPSLQFGMAAQFRLGGQMGDQQAADGFCGRAHGGLGLHEQGGSVAVNDVNLRTLYQHVDSLVRLVRFVGRDRARARGVRAGRRGMRSPCRDRTGCS